VATSANGDQLLDWW